MANSKPKRPKTGAPQQVLSLSDLLGALSQEFVVAAVNHHATMTYWEQAYENNPVLSDHHPLGMNIVSAQVSLPVAVSQVTAKPARAAQLTKTMITEAISSDIPKSKRQEIARVIHADLAREGKLYFSNSHLITDLDEAVKANLPDTKNPLNKQFILDLQREFLAQPARNSEILFIYRAKDLEQIKSDLIFRLNLDLKLE
jgi:hypothetical protein